MFFQNGITKIGDLGIAKWIHSEEKENFIQGTPIYLAPECILESKYNYKTDIWAVGVCIYQLLTLGVPFRGKNISELENAIINNKPKEISKLYSDELKGIVLSMMDKDSMSRPTVEECINILETNLLDIQIQTNNFEKVINYNTDSHRSSISFVKPNINKHTKTRSSVSNFIINNDRNINSGSKLTIFDLK
jgi:serine/threonine protein kinase